MFDQGNGDCSTYQPGAINEGYCERDEACSSCACACACECGSCGSPDSSAFALQLVDCGDPAPGAEGCCRVEVFVSGEWGTVCDDYWDDQDARVVCAEVGCSGGNATAVGVFGGGVGQIWLDNVMCTGSEASLSECPHNGWGHHNCGHHEDAGDEGSCFLPCRALSLLPGRMHMAPA